MEYGSEIKELDPLIFMGTIFERKKKDETDMKVTVQE